MALMVSVAGHHVDTPHESSETVFCNTDFESYNEYL